jgi:hypothetical protein
MSKLQVDDIVNKGDDGSPSFPKGAVVTGVCTATTFSGTATEASAAKSGSALETSINSKTSPGKAIALSMVFG